MANSLIKKIKIGNTTYDIAVDSIDKVAGLREILEGHHSVEGNVLVIGENSEEELVATPITKIKLADGTYKIKDPEASRIIEIVDLTA